ncbi:hypothetical protein LPJ68_000039 [Coemansia sp. RSA 1086]|nr:hypothetical protein LPJ68_000039 [Coemansia sp. RSA 1086]
MDIDLLGDDDQYSCNLTPAIQPQPKPPDLSQQLSSLNLATASNGATDDDEFGEFLQSAEPNSNVPVKSHATQTTLRPAITNKLECATARRNTIATPQQSNSSQCIADRILGWISDPKLTSLGSLPDDAIDRAWDSAAGLLGGTDLKPHIGEIATRLCSAIPRDSPAANQTPELLSATMLSAEKTAELSESLLVKPLSSSASFGRQINSIAWPQYKPTTSKPTAVSNEDLVSAYLRLVDKTT